VPGEYLARPEDLQTDHPITGWSASGTCEEMLVVLRKLRESKVEALASAVLEVVDEDGQTIYVAVDDPKAEEIILAACRKGKRRLSATVTGHKRGRATVGKKKDGKRAERVKPYKRRKRKSKAMKPGEYVPPPPKPRRQRPSRAKFKPGDFPPPAPDPKGKPPGWK
jgi:hypothetical protein